MSTSGFYQASGDLLITCDLCWWEGFVPAVEDYERMSLTWVCGGCGHEEEMDLGHDEDA
jgi:hypothetical protein